MFRVMVVDDEPLVLEGMRLFPWDTLGCEIVGEAYDGKEALALVQELNPDIVLTDIQMPEMTGLEFAREVFALKKDVAILIFTGYPRFSYAQEALRIGVMDYLVKPVSFPALKQTIEKIVSKLEQRRLSTQVEIPAELIDEQYVALLQEQWLTNALNGIIDRRAAIAKSLEGETFVVIVVGTEGKAGLEEYAFRDILQQQLQSSGFKFIVQQELNHYVILLWMSLGTRVDSMQMAVTKFLETLQIDIWNRYSFSFSAALSLPDTDIESLNLLKHQAYQTFQEHHFQQSDAISIYVEHELPAPSFDLIHRFKKMAVTSLLSRQQSELSEVLAQFVIELRDSEYEAALCNKFIRYLVIDIAAVVQKFIETSLNDFELIIDEDTQSMLQRAERYLTELHHMLQSNEVELERMISRTVTHYIRENYAKDISLSTLSEELCYSTAYLSRLIRKCCHKNFIEMLIDERMSRAENLLKLTKDSVGSIAERVGYNSVGYFISTFKKRNGCTPAEFRQQTVMQYN